jgi:hypothetical protein
LIRDKNPLGILAATVLLATACSGSTPTDPPVVSNTPPTIESLVIAGQRAEAGEEIQVTASVKDAESAVAQLTYVWSASPQNGTFANAGAIALWRPPKGQISPQLYTITLTVTENYTSAGQPKQNIVSSSVTVHYNDSVAEATGIAVQFIKDFGTYTVTPEQCVRNFSDNCQGKQDELDQIKDNRANFRIISAELRPAQVTFDVLLTSGVVDGLCVFFVFPISGENAGRPERVTGTCYLTTVYENFRWYLCDSFFRPPFTTTPLGLRGRVPGRLRFD